MKISHLNCATLCPPGGGLVSGEGGPLHRGHLVCHCLLIETPSGLVLVDTGLGRADLADPRGRLGGNFPLFASPKLDPAETALAQVEAMGAAANDVRHIVLTHLDLDHAGGLGDFPDARVHVMAGEHRAAEQRASLLEKHRYRPAQWAAVRDWRDYETEGEPWHGFACVRALDGLPPEVLMVPLIGHSHGHAGVAVDSGDGWILHAGDAYFHRDEMAARPSCPWGLRFFQRTISVNETARRENQARLRDLRGKRDDVAIFCAHDPEEWLALSTASSASGRTD